LDLIQDYLQPATDFTLFPTVWDPRRLLFLLLANAELRYTFLQRDLTPPTFIWATFIMVNDYSSDAIF
jgi:hypothetical protein